MLHPSRTRIHPVLLRPASDRVLFRQGRVREYLKFVAHRVRVDAMSITSRSLIPLSSVPASATARVPHYPTSTAAVRLLERDYLLPWNLVSRSTNCTIISPTSDAVCRNGRALMERHSPGPHVVPMSDVDDSVHAARNVSLAMTAERDYDHTLRYNTASIVNKFPSA